MNWKVFDTFDKGISLKRTYQLSYLVIIFISLTMIYDLYEFIIVMKFKNFIFRILLFIFEILTIASIYKMTKEIKIIGFDNEEYVTFDIFNKFLYHLCYIPLIFDIVGVSYILENRVLAEVIRLSFIIFYIVEVYYYIITVKFYEHII